METVNQEKEDVPHRQMKLYYKFARSLCTVAIYVCTYVCILYFSGKEEQPWPIARA